MFLSHVCRCGPLQRGEEGHHQRVPAPSCGHLHRRARSRDPESDSEERKCNSAFQLQTTLFLLVLVILTCPRRSALPSGSHSSLLSGAAGLHKDRWSTWWRHLSVGPRVVAGRGCGQSVLSGSALQPGAPSRRHTLSPKPPCGNGLVCWWQAPCRILSYSFVGLLHPIFCWSIECDF